MKSNKLLISISLLFILALYSCHKAELNAPVSSECSLPFTDNSATNPKNSVYQALLDNYVKKGFPGLVVLIKTPRDGVWIGAAGYSRIEDKTPMNKCNILYSASVGKTYCAVAILKLAEEGKINLDDKISKYLPADICSNIPNGNLVTIRNLLAHRSGIPNFEDNPQFIADFLNNPYAITKDKLIKYEYGKTALFQPDEKFRYSSTGYELLAKIIDQVTGETHSKYYTSRIFQPLGLTNTYYKNEAGFPNPNGLVNCYFDRLGDGKIENVSDVNNYVTQVFTGSDGVMASAYDYLLFMEALAKGKLVNSNSYQQMTDWKPTSTTSTNQYGLGLMKRETIHGTKIGHTGRAVGEGIDAFYFPNSEVTIITAINLGTFLDTKLPLIYSNEFQTELADAVFK